MKSQLALKRKARKKKNKRNPKAKSGGLLKNLHKGSPLFRPEGRDGP